ncbi:MAG: hypothetical protein FOGNACKC_05643 [Anaerolineae bacterium]|nr:hypothetical protein [Anaerolineae bacterium]
MVSTGQSTQVAQKDEQHMLPLLPRFCQRMALPGDRFQRYGGRRSAVCQHKFHNLFWYLIMDMLNKIDLILTIFLPKIRVSGRKGGTGRNYTPARPQ